MGNTPLLSKIYFNANDLSKKHRTPIPPEVAADIAYRSHQTCCVCNIQYAPTQVHHLNENPSDHRIVNLALLCLNCHNEAHKKGGFGRKMTAEVIRTHRDKWYSRVETIRNEIDSKLSVSSMVNGTEEPVPKVTPEFSCLRDKHILQLYLQKICIFHRAQNESSHLNWDSGVTAEMKQGSHEMINFYEGIFVELARFYPEKHFDLYHPSSFFHKVVSHSFDRHWKVLHPEGIGTGSIAGIIVGGEVMDEVRLLIEKMVHELIETYFSGHEEGYDQWLAKWQTFPA